MVDFNDFKKRVAVDINKSMPHATVELPSNGTKALICAMKVKDQKDFLKALEKKDDYLINECFDRILSNCVETIDDKPFDNDTVCIQDRAYLLLKVRELTTGPNAKITHICPKTQEVVNNIDVDISKFPVVKYEGNINTIIELTPLINVVLGPVTRKVEKDMEKWLKLNNAKDSIADHRYCAYAGIIKAVKLKDEATNEYMDVTGMTFEKKLEFLTEYCRNEHLEKLDEFLKTLDFGVKPTFHFKSSEYENEKEEANIISFFIW